MNITLYMAISADGFIAKKDGDSDWVSEADAENFEQTMQEFGCIIVGRRTFEQYQDDLYPVEGVTNIVLSSDASREPTDENVVHVASPQEAIEVAKKRGHDRALLIGGGRANGAFLENDLIDEVYVSVYPLILGDGIKLFEGTEKEVKLMCIDQEVLAGELVQLHYKVKR